MYVYMVNKIAVKYCEMTCAAKEIHSTLIEGVGSTEKQRTVESFLRECRHLRLPSPTSGG